MPVKLRIYHRPMLLVLLFSIVAAGFASAGVANQGVWQKLFVVIGGMYTVALLLSGLLAARVIIGEGEFIFDHPERLLLIAPHQDDCVLMAGGLGLQNQRLGGETHLVSLTQPDDANLAATRREEAINAWKLAGVPEENLRHYRLLPKRGRIARADVQRLAAELQKLVGELKPALICVPLFEAGHLHHDVTHHVVTHMLKLPRSTHIYEAPEYSPYFSPWRTPNKALSYLARIAFLGIISYYPKPEGVGRGHILNLKMNAEGIELKRRMLQEFRTQNGDSLARNHGYADRFYLWKSGDYRRTPFVFEGSMPWLVERMKLLLPPRLVGRLFPGDHHTIGLERGITDLERCKLLSLV